VIWYKVEAMFRPKVVFSAHRQKQKPLNLMLLTVLATAILCLAGLAQAQDANGPMSDLHFVVVRDYNGKPVRNAAVVLHPVNRKGKQERGGLELKTDGEGRTTIDGIPYGPLRIQVLAPGFQTFGEDYQIDKPALEITVKLKRPGSQYSIYDKPADAKTTDAKANSDKTNGDKKSPDPKPQQQ
jgi:hypothetical protein